jgi:cobalt/nickel transport system permease protein
LNSANTIKSIYQQAESAAEKGFIHMIDPRVKLISLLFMAIIISIVNTPYVQIVLTVFILFIFILARLNIFQVYRKIFLLAFFFGFIVVLPASLNVITPGKIIFNIIAFKKPSQFWIYKIPENIGFTREGFLVVFLVFLRVLNSVSFALLIVFTTPFPAFVKSFKIIGVPDTFLMIISLAYKFIFILSRTIEDTYFALKSRLSGNIRNKSLRKLVSGRIFFIFKRSVMIYENTYFAMVSRGYSGQVKLLTDQQIKLSDAIVMMVIFAVGIVVLFL